MIIEKIETYDGKEYKLTYSDCNKQILQTDTNTLFDSALDDTLDNHIYTETDLDI